MNLCIDQGNTSVKVGVFDGDELVYINHAQQLDPAYLRELISTYSVRHSILSSTASQSPHLGKVVENSGASFHEFSASTALPFTNAYKTPETLGKDRLAGIAGASALKPDSDLLVVDAGTAITFDFIDAGGVYRGGNISPGLEMRAKSLHSFTHRLPLVELSEPEQFLGVDTSSAILNGVIYGAVFEIDGYIESLLLNYPKLSTFLTGGSSFYFDNKLKNRTFAVKNLVLTGLNRILNFNVQ